MTDLMRPALYGAYHRIEPVTPRAGALHPCDVVGPVCETHRHASGATGSCRRVEVGDLMAIRTRAPTAR